MVDPFETALKALLSDKLAEYVDVGYYGAVDAPSATVTVTGRVPDAEKRLVASMKPANVLLWRDQPDEPAREYAREPDVHTATGADLDRAAEALGFGPAAHCRSGGRRPLESDASFRERILFLLNSLARWRPLPAAADKDAEIEGLKKRLSAAMARNVKTAAAVAERDATIAELTRKFEGLKQKIDTASLRDKVQLQYKIVQWRNNHSYVVRQNKELRRENADLRNALDTARREDAMADLNAQRACDADLPPEHPGASGGGMSSGPAPLKVGFETGIDLARRGDVTIIQVWAANGEPMPPVTIAGDPAAARDAALRRAAARAAALGPNRAIAGGRRPRRRSCIDARRQAPPGRPRAPRYRSPLRRRRRHARHAAARPIGA